MDAAVGKTFWPPCMCTPDWNGHEKCISNNSYENEELRKEVRQLKRELLEAKQKREENSTKSKEKEEDVSRIADTTQRQIEASRFMDATPDSMVFGRTPPLA
ncbi:hypothetical protein UY3_06278 [Chelonia mydas]|uniref:Uncharacterized protein n=1 Tax=Chelonia mydas TaxID=8469 RepID=M7BH30_CHEMY|nr:hypothetical protein UY3_06278 [Chelonia mydas]